MYVKFVKNVKTIISIYVDDLVIMPSTESALLQVKQRLTNRFEMKDLGKLHCLNRAWRKLSKDKSAGLH